MSRKPLNLTHTQRFILNHAQGQERGLVAFTRGDRLGTRCIGYDALGVPLITAYASPEFHLKARGFLKPYGNQPATYQITDAGMDAVARCKTAGKPHEHRRRR